MDNYSFRGHHHHSMDEKGRILIPKAFRYDIDDNPIKRFIITKGFGECLYAFPYREWKKTETKLKRKPIKSHSDAFDLRNIIAFTDDQSPDNMGRITLNKYFRGYASLNSEIVIVGMINHLEIWDAAKWEEYISQDDHDKEEVDSIILKIGFFDGEYS